MASVDNINVIPTTTSTALRDDDSLFPNARRGTFCSNLIAYLLMVIIVPLYLVVISIVLLLWMVSTITCIGPMIHHCYSKKEDLVLEKLLIDHPEMGFLEIPAGINAASGAHSYRVSTRVTIPKNSNNNLPVIIFPGGLAATLFCMHKAQDRLTEEGFICLQYDRLGVGYSDVNPTGIPASAFDCVNEMDYVMRNTPNIPVGSKFISLGASMGAIVTEAFMSIYPNRLVGFINVDGLPHSFIKTNKLFIKTFAPMYKGMASIVWTGLMRSMFSGMKSTLQKSFSSKNIGVAPIMAQMMRKRFFANAYLEFFTMMSCADLSCTAWGAISPTKMDTDLFYRCVTVAPTRSTIVDERDNIAASDTLERSSSELGVSWATPGETRATLDVLRQKAPVKSEDLGDLKVTNADNNEHPISKSGFVGGISAETVVHPLPPQFQNMFVRVLSARSYDMGDSSMLGEWGYPQVNRNRSSSEHNLHALLAKDGARIVYPKLTHASVFAQTEQIVAVMNEFKEFWSKESV